MRLNLDELMEYHRAAVYKIDGEWEDATDAILDAVPAIIKRIRELEAEVKNLEDAPEVEARIQNHLMYQYEKTVQCAEITGGFCPNRDTMLYYATLAAKNEMEKEDADR